MSFDTKTVTIFGGAGFVGRHIVRDLARLGYTIKIACRVPERAYFLKPCGVVGQVVPVACDYSDSRSIMQAIKGSDFVVNCIGILHERRKGDFVRVHTDIPAAIASACNAENVSRLVHISALGVEQDQSRYAKTKLGGEGAVLQLFPKTTILCPSVIFGPDDDFFNKFAALARIMPMLPLIGGGKTKFQPVYVGDVAQAVTVCLTAGDEICGRVFELGGPEVVDFRGIYNHLFKYTKRPRPLVSLPWSVAGMQAFFMGMLPNPMLTRDQILSLKSDHTVSKDALKLQDLGIEPTSMDIILPTYLGSYRSGGRFADQKAA
jgi:uncharacterized protein YbjT (DUF2867 family)